MLRTVFFSCLLVVMFSAVCLAQDINALNDRFYGGLADVIERNMNEPEQCVDEVNSYYENNQALIAQIKAATKKVMQQAAPMMSQIAQDYSSVQSEEELKAIEKKYEGMQKGAQQAQMSAAMSRYQSAFERFCQKYPNQGIQIAAKALELMPKLDQGQYYQE